MKGITETDKGGFRPVRRRLALTLAAVALAAALLAVSCGDSEEGPDYLKDWSESRIVILMPEANLPDKARLGAIVDAVNASAFEAVGAEVAIELYDGYSGTLKEEILSGRQIDLFFAWTDDLVTFDLGRDIGDDLKKYAPNYYSTLEPRHIEAYTINGALCMVPRRYVSSERLAAVVRKDVMDASGAGAIKDAASYGAFMAAAKKVTDLYPAADVALSFKLFKQDSGYVSAAANDICVRPESGEFIIWPHTDDFDEYLRTAAAWKSEGYTFPCSNYVDEMRYGRIASFIIELDLAAITAAQLAPFVEVAVYPLSVGVPTANLLYNPGFAVNAMSPNAGKALAFIEWLYGSQEGYDLLMYGIEGEDYLLTGGRVGFPAGKAAYGGWKALIALQDLPLARAHVNDVADFREAIESGVKPYLSGNVVTGELDPSLGELNKALQEFFMRTTELERYVISAEELDMEYIGLLLSTLEAGDTLGLMDRNRNVFLSEAIFGP
ncbi:MAG: extracellular solute-binding protein [Oscillospiraceae bacterium]|nr:extracellular solute-binding protein [Oscillospiraceae bacterium]